MYKLKFESKHRATTNHGKSLIIVVLFVCIILLATGFFSYSFGYNTASQRCYEQGYMEGFAIGNSTGYDAGYQVGNENGNTTGYELGYKTGFDQGSSDGYSKGFEEGKSTGYSSGYENGYSTGFTKGNASGYDIGYASGYDQGYSSGFTKGNSTGYNIGFDSGYLQGIVDGASRGFNIRDPTYQEAMNFITQDPTDKNAYVPETYTCFHFTADVKNNALKVGYRCGFVYIRFPDSAHAIVCFNTTDRGLVFIEPQDDGIMTLMIGQPYWDRTQYLAPDYDDTIVYYTIIW